MQQTFDRVLVTGGAGFVGHRVTRLLQSRGTAVAVIDNLLSRLPLPAQTALVQPYQADIRDAGRLQAILAEFRPQAIIHLAAIHHIPTCEKNPREAMDVNIVGTQTVLDAAEASGVKHIVIASSSAVYDWWETALIEDETPLRASDVYSIGKITNEQQLKVWAERSGGRGGITRIFNVIGHDDPNGHIIPDILAQLDLGTATIGLGNTAPKRDYTHADDTARGVVALLDHLEVGAAVEAYNLSRGEEHSVADLVAAMGRCFGRTITIEHDPARVRRVDRLHLLGDTTKAKRVLGWQADISFDQALADILAQLAPQLVAVR